MAPSPEARKACWVETGWGWGYLQMLHPVLLAQEVAIGSIGRLAGGLRKVFRELLGELADDLLLGLVLFHEQLHVLLKSLHLLLPQASLVHQAISTLLQSLHPLVQLRDLPNLVPDQLQPVLVLSGCQVRTGSSLLLLGSLQGLV